MDLKQTSSEDRSAVESLITSAPLSHVHLDWLEPVSLTSKEPFILATVGDDSVGALGCPPDLPGVSWVRIFAAAGGYDAEQVWERLWSEGANQLLTRNVRRVAAIALEDWFAHLLLAAGFKRTNAVIFYELQLDFEGGAGEDELKAVRPISPKDAEKILELDRIAFEPIWQLSAEALSVAMIQASSAGIIEEKGEALGYQITTSSPFGAHLARLAVLPSRQREGFGTALVNDAIEGVRDYGLDLLSVNTQEDNISSRKLYEKLGFQLTGKEFPVFEIEL